MLGTVDMACAASVNAPGFYYQQVSTTVVRAIPCPDNTYSKGLDKAASCMPCPANFKTDPENTAGSHTSVDVCGERHSAVQAGVAALLCCGPMACSVQLS